MAVHYFNKHAQEGNTVLAQLAREIGEPDDPKKAERVLKAVLHTLRDRLTLEESFQLMAQFPLFLKGIYVSEWKLRREPLRIRHIEEFIGQAAIRDRSSEQDFVNTERATFLIKKVFKIMGQYVSDGEWQDVLDNLPEQLHPLVTPALSTK